MAGYLIHIIIGEEYIKKHIVENEEEFIKGTIYPDSVKIKGETHYSPFYSGDTNLYEFLKDRKLDNSFNLGYFLHLVVDCIFYNKYFLIPFGTLTEEVHNDYDILNKGLIEKYNPKIPEEIKKYTKFKEGTTKILDAEKVHKCIEEASNYNLIELGNRILKEKDYGNILKLKR